MKWYTAVGVKLESADGAFCVRTGSGVKNLLGAECYVWNTLLWSFVEESEIYGRMAWLLKLSFPKQPEKTKISREEFAYCLRRLLTRGLAVCREDETTEGAAEALLKAAEVACVGRTWGERFLLFCGYAAEGMPLRYSLQAFQKLPEEKTHKHLLRDIRGKGTAGFSMKEIGEEQRGAVLELYRKKLLFIQSVKEGSIG